MSFSNFLDDFILKLDKPNHLPHNVQLLYPFDQREIQSVCRTFYKKFFNDDQKRIMLLGINPGRFGAGITGVPFTDPIRLQEICDIPNTLDKRPELSSKFIYELIEAYGGPHMFYSDFIFSSVCPFGFTKEDKNLNYYDLPELRHQLEAFNVEALKQQITMGGCKKIALSVGKGKNYKYLHQLNKQHALFDTIDAIPHPRWVMQYRLKRKDEFIDEIVKKLKEISLISHC